MIANIQISDTRQNIFNQNIFDCMNYNFSSTDKMVSCILLPSLNSETYFLKDNIRLYIKKENGEFHAEIPSLGISEYHLSMEDIYSDIPNYIIDIYDHLSVTPYNKLSKSLQNQKREVTKYVEKAV